MPLKLIKEAHIQKTLSERQKQHLKLLGEAFGMKNTPLHVLQETFDEETNTVTPADYNQWTSAVVDLCREQNKKPHSKRSFMDCAFQVLDNDPKMDLFLGDDIESIKLGIANTMWNAFQASHNHSRLEPTMIRSKKAREEEEMKGRHEVGSWTEDDFDKMADIDQELDMSRGGSHANDIDDELDMTGGMSDDEYDYSEDDINVATNTYPDEDLGEWDVPLRRDHEEEQESEFSQLFKQSMGVEEEETTNSPAYKAGYEAGITSKGKNPYHKRTARSRMWDKGHKAGRSVVKTHSEEEESGSKALTSIQNNGYMAAKKYFHGVMAAARGGRQPAPADHQNPHPVGTSAAEAWNAGFDMFIRDTQDK